MFSIGEKGKLEITSCKYNGSERKANKKERCHSTCDSTALGR
jgi:hypothetical protein